MERLYVVHTMIGFQEIQVAGSTVRVSVGEVGQQGNGASLNPVYLADGRTVVFASAASNLIVGDSNGRTDIFAKDLISGHITRLTPDTFNQDVSLFTVSGDGKTIAFQVETRAETSDQLTRAQLYTIDTTNGTLTEITTSDYARGLYAILPSTSTGNTINPGFSADGKKLVFSSSDLNLVADDTNGAIDVFVKDLITGSISRVSSASSGAQAVSAGNTLSPNKLPDSYQPFFNSDGSKVVFTSNANDLVANDTNGRADTFIKDLVTGAVRLIPTEMPEARSGYSTNFQAYSISPDSTKLILEEVGVNTGGGGVTTTKSLYMQDLDTGALTMIDSARRIYGTGHYNAEFSPDSTKVIYNQIDYTYTPILIASPTTQIYMKDLATGIRVSVLDIPRDDRGGYGASFSPDGRKVVFTGLSDQITPGDTNRVSDVFVRDFFNPVFGKQVIDASVTGGKVYALYEGLLGRAPDSLGLEVNVGAVKSGLSLGDLAASMLGSPEGQARSGAATDTAFVTQFYRTTLGREPDAAGLANWVNFLGAGGSRADVGVGFSLSTEHLTAIQPQLAQGVIVNDVQAAQAARLYYAVFDRAPDVGGLADWTSYLKSGGTLKDAANAFLGSAESRASGTSDNATFVKSIYTNALDRQADAGGLANWVSYLDSGGSRGEVTAAIANSVEAQVHLVGVIENGWFLG